MTAVHKSVIRKKMEAVGRRIRPWFRLRRRPSPADAMMEAVSAVARLEEQGLLLVDWEQPGVVLTTRLWLVYFTQAYVETRSDERTMAFLLACRTLAGMRRLAAGGRPLAPDDHLFITCMTDEGADAVPLFVGYATAADLVIRDYAEARAALSVAAAEDDGREEGAS